MLSRLAAVLSRLSERYVPGALAIAVLLTAVVSALALSLTPAPPTKVVEAWGSGLWSLNGFAMQMCVVVLTGYLVSTAPAADRALGRIARLATSPRGAVTLMAAVSMTLAWIHWGMSLVAGATLVRHLRRAQPRVDYRLLVASAYLGMGTTWHAGLSGSAPLLVATPGHFLADAIGIIPVGATIFHPFNLTLVIVVMVVMTLAIWSMHPEPGDAVTAGDTVDERTDGDASCAHGTAHPVERSRVMSLAAGGLGVAAIAMGVHAGGSLTLDVLNLAALSLAFLLHPHLASLQSAGERGARLLAGIVLQFPLYGGMFGIIQGTGLARVLGDAIAAHASAGTLPLWLYWYSSVLNYVVPSGGSKWAIEAPFLIEAASRLGVGADRVVLAYAWGDMASNLIQPFWALPLLAGAGLGFRDIMGYAAVSFGVITLVVSIAFALMPLTW